MDERQRRCGLPNCQWCGRKKFLVVFHQLINGGHLVRMPPGGVLLCPRCDEGAQGVGPLATIIARVAARHIGARQPKEPNT